MVSITLNTPLIGLNLSFVMIFFPWKILFSKCFEKNVFPRKDSAKKKFNILKFKRDKINKIDDFKMNFKFFTN